MASGAHLHSSTDGAPAMHDLLASKDAMAMIGGIGFCICIAVIAIGCTIAVQWRKVRQVEIEAALKKEILDRGMSADDVIKILGASSASSDESNVVELAKEGMSADEIVKIMQQRQKVG
jgi:hypothetical protein